MSDFTVPIILKPNFSNQLALVLMVLHNGALLLLFTLAMSSLTKFGMGLFILVSSWYTTRRYLLFINHSLYGCILSYDQLSHCIRVKLRCGQESQLTTGSYSHPLLVILRVKGCHNALVLFADALDQHTFRHLRVHIRHANFDCHHGVDH
jgi:hypothetical protein